MAIRSLPRQGSFDLTMSESSLIVKKEILKMRKFPGFTRNSDQFP
ncbi:hypothetical protein LEP1GSC202_1859 [Leptospira yanagawae serovar Saopaulo str. Sao Paulo = ATCC 700523]|uniref:Uncharacterized protein n=1 Tax=Leptospira yanagawae serovar Saopaulo str. Sao Paulo = ATCC 700523 TaxID=1249483 RepID=A0A5E8HGT4_9LEPT|nr:hypothetical protein LEP1GSC202_1859 [Leptospira yanagawae serovar Saopaulo str. Sao Paulo = ATCC 700523]